ncbi:non-hydrolyzing UDP-N-acetylglucosamine 2-epimerase [Cohnella luojiensis]|uniref:UDP-N-acetylglucosamine 2-epimerase (Non-hydrolyzing) n=1 Tax=Cohnella luojiensis TaxID=652876 RepID=A0A4Y8M5L8_9BACL|nr:UDP-N-acetylglucosamine 2-epimerase (non-hydrolyzing) [Cohnella luojiensis]TFE27851.1 UDP-N-acetylglucosamine 2-epimerase (non-hydrolyzing) [Cohnella luojiensis]
MRIVTILGTRPEIIRLSLLIRKLDLLADRHVLVHTGQNFSPSLSAVFFEQLGLRAPDLLLDDRKETIGGQLSVMFGAVEQLLRKEQPDRVLVLGDTNSALCALVAERMGIPVVHMEAGNRCFDLNVPEEKNRRVIDAVSTYNLPYTENSKHNLLREGFPVQRIFRSGNPIYEVLRHYEEQIDRSTVLERLGLTSGQYLLATIHRAENVDDPEALAGIIQGLSSTAEEHRLPLVCSLHPRTRSKLTEEISSHIHPLVKFHEPFGFFDFVYLEKHTRCALTDSGTVQEECCIFGVPTVTIRQTTERPETVDCGSNAVAGLKPERIRSAARVMMALTDRWKCPEGYLEENVSDKVAKFVLGGKRDV